MLKYDYPENKNAQPSLFEMLEPATKEKIISSGANVELTNRKGEGIKLTKGEYKLILSLSKILHEKSQTKDSSKNDYYAGNKGAELIPIKTKENESVELKSPKIGDCK